MLCRPCHRNVHVAIENKELEQEYNTLAALASHPSIQRFTGWIRNKPHGTTLGKANVADIYEKLVTEEPGRATWILG